MPIELLLYASAGRDERELASRNAPTALRRIGHDREYMRGWVTLPARAS